MKSRKHRDILESRKLASKPLSSYTIDAAALQNDIARRFKLPGGNIVAPSQFNPSISSKNYLEPKVKLCPSCERVNTTASPTCLECGVFFPIPSNIQETLAQRRGLVKKTEVLPMVSYQEWDHIEDIVKDREDAYCPICMAGFNQGSEVLLSCSHMFHRKCLQAFEQYMKADERNCPICRSKNYQKKMTSKGSRAFEVVCVRKIQALWRGYRARKTYYNAIKSFYQSGCGDKQLRKKFYQRELSIYTDSILSDADVHGNTIDDVLRSTDVALAESRQLDLLFDTILQQRSALAVYHDPNYRSAEDLNEYHITSTHSSQRVDIADVKQNVDDDSWNEITSKAVARGVGDCAICMNPNFCIPYRCLVVLSCSHVFHHQCIGTFEKFWDHQNSSDSTICSQSQYACPLCRYPGYEKKVFDHRLLHRR